MIPAVRCAACGAENPAVAVACLRCGEPLVADDGALPPIPDGGLAAMMPDWLREPPAAPPAAPADAVPTDPRAWLTPDDLSPWMRELPAAPPAAEGRPAAPAPLHAAPPLFLPDAVPAAPPAGRAPAADAPEGPWETAMDSGVAAGLATALIVFLALVIAALVWRGMTGR